MLARLEGSWDLQGNIEILQQDNNFSNLPDSGSTQPWTRQLIERAVA